MSNLKQSNKIYFIAVMIVAFSTVFLFQNCGKMKSIKSVKNILDSGSRTTNIVGASQQIPREYLAPVGLGFNEQTKTVFWDALPPINYNDANYEVTYNVTIAGSHFGTNTLSWYTMSDSFYFGLNTGAVSWSVQGCIYTEELNFGTPLWHCESSSSTFTKPANTPPTEPIMGKPANLNFNSIERNLTWSSVDRAGSYQIQLDGVFFDEVTSLSYTVPNSVQEGNHSLGVRACRIASVHLNEICGDFTTIQVTLENPPEPLQAYASISYVNSRGYYRTQKVYPGTNPIILHKTEEFLGVTLHTTGGEGNYTCTYLNNGDGPYGCESNYEYYWDNSPFDNESTINATVRSGPSSVGITFTLKPAASTAN